MRPFGKAQSKTMRAYAQNGQYHTIVESRVRLTINNMREEPSPTTENNFYVSIQILRKYGHKIKF